MDKKSDVIRQHTSSLNSGDRRQFSALMRQGDIMMKQGRFQDALNPYGAALKQTPRVAVLRVRIAHAFLSLNDFPNALRHFQAAFDLGMKSVEVINQIAICLDRLDAEESCFNWVSEHLHMKGAPAQFNIIAARQFQINGDLETALSQSNLALQKEPDSTYAQVTFDTLQEMARDGSVGTKDQTLKVAFHLNEAFHSAIMKPIFDVLKAHFQVLITEDFNWLRRFSPDVVFVANAQARNMRKHLPQSIFVYTRHGLISKNFVYDAARACDYVCLPSEDVKSDFVERGGFKPESLWVTGYSQMDPLFRKEHLPLSVAIPNNTSCILYAPTFTDRLSSVPEVTPVIEAGKLDMNRQLIIKPHPLSFKHQASWMRRLRAYAATKDNVHFISDSSENIVPYLARADILISDASSVMFQYLALDRPVIAVNNPERFTAPQYDPEGVEWKWRGMAHEIEDVSSLPALVENCLTYPNEKQLERATYRKLLFGSCTDGQTGARILSHLKTLDLSKNRQPNAAK